MKKNAQAPLSSLYDHNSPLEQLHYTLLLHILRRQGFGFLLDNSHSTPHHFRKLLAETVLATDMRVHSQFMGRFQRIVDGAEADHWTRRVLVCQALIKAADISNPVMNTSLLIDPRPCLNNHPVSPYQCLTTLGVRPSRGVDFTGHSRATPSPESISKGRGRPPVRSQISSLVYRNLRETSVRSHGFWHPWSAPMFPHPFCSLLTWCFSETAEYALHCTENLAKWKARIQSLSLSRDDSPDSSRDTLGRSTHERDRSFSPHQSPEDYVSAFPMALPTSFRLGIDQSDRLSVHDSATSDTLAPVLTDTDSSRASSPTHSTAPSIGTVHLPFSIASTCPTSSVSSPSPSVTSTSHSVGLSEAPSTQAALLGPSHGDALGLVVSGGVSSSESSAAAIRAACKVGVRRRPSFHRYSWSPGPRDIPARREVAIVAGQGVDS